jgi:opacity protein-like surface antigen
MKQDEMVQWMPAGQRCYMSFSATIFSAALPAFSNRRLISSSIFSGWTVGGGIKYVLSRNWSLKGEYLYTSFPNQTANQFNPGFPIYTGVAKGDLMFP